MQESKLEESKIRQNCVPELENRIKMMDESKNYRSVTILLDGQDEQNGRKI